jgi:hypothetical protein
MSKSMFMFYFGGANIFKTKNYLPNMGVITIVKNDQMCRFFV